MVERELKRKNDFFKKKNNYKKVDILINLLTSDIKVYFFKTKIGI